MLVCQPHPEPLLGFVRDRSEAVVAGVPVNRLHKSSGTPSHTACTVSRSPRLETLPDCGIPPHPSADIPRPFLPGVMFFYSCRPPRYRDHEPLTRQLLGILLPHISHCATLLPTLSIQDDPTEDALPVRSPIRTVISTTCGSNLRCGTGFPTETEGVYYKKRT